MFCANCTISFKDLGEKEGKGGKKRRIGPPRIWEKGKRKANAFTYPRNRMEGKGEKGEGVSKMN